MNDYNDYNGKGAILWGMGVTLAVAIIVVVWVIF